MASNRPAWFRLSSMRPTAPPLAPPRPPPAPPLVRPVRPPPPPTQTQQPAPPPSLPPTAPPSPQGPAVTAPPSPPVPAAAPPMSPVAPPAPPPTSPTMLPPPPQASPPKARSATPAPKSPTPAPPNPPPASPMTNSSLTTSTKFLRPSSSSLPTSPSTSKITSPVAKPAAAAAPTEPVNVKAATPVSSPKIVKLSENSPLQSPKMKPLSHPPSPLKLPPPQIIASEGEREPKIEEKDVLVQDKPMKIHNNPHNHANATIGKRQQPPIKDKKLSNSEESGRRMITIAGDNKGAVMEITPSHRRTAGAHSLHNKEKSEKETTMQTQAKTTFLNSNVQGVNNSIVFNSDYHHNDPGIHLCVVRKVNGGRYKD